MWDLAFEYDVKVFQFYGGPVYGKGTVDTWSSFGVKKPLSEQILGDKWFSDARELVD